MEFSKAVPRRALRLILLAVMYVAFPSMIIAQPFYIQRAGQLRAAHIKEMRSDGFSATRIGGGMMDDVENITIGFQLSKSPSLDEARIMYVRGVEGLLIRINQDEAIRPFLHNYPFTVDNLDYSLSFDRISNRQSQGVSIAFVSCVRGKIFYCSYDPVYLSTNPLRTIHREPYEEALRIVKESGALNLNAHSTQDVDTSDVYFGEYFDDSDG